MEGEHFSFVSAFGRVPDNPASRRDEALRSACNSPLIPPAMTLQGCDI